MNTAKLTTALVVCLALLATVGASSAFAAFGIENFTNTYSDPSGAPLLEAGSHADTATNIEFAVTQNLKEELISDGQVRDVEVNLPAGYYGNPRAVPTCSMAALQASEGYCNPAAQVGVFNYEFSPGGFALQFPIYNLDTPNSETDVLGVVVVGVPQKIVISARTDGDYGLTAKLSSINQSLLLFSNKVVLWGNPAATVHDPERYTALFVGGAEANIPVKPFLTLPGRCEPVTTTVRVDSWQEPGVWHTASETTPPLEGCDELDFAPSLKTRPTTNVADSASGLEANLTLPQNTTDPEARSTAMLKTAEVALPEGLVINPSAANGLAACSPQQIGLTTAVGAGAPHFSKEPAQCPDASRLGSVEIVTPVFADPLKGSVYTMAPHQNPFGTLLGVYAVVEGHGLVIKLPGKVITNPQTGQLTATFDENPQLPFEEFKLSFDGGQTGILRTPVTCGNFASSSNLVPWSAPETPSVSGSNQFAITASPTACAGSEAALPNTPAFSAGSTSSAGGAYSPFVLNLSRGDGTQQLTGIDATLPPGLLAKLDGVPYCSDAALAAAASREGTAEQAAPSCPAASQVGTVSVAAGAGPKPFNAPGKAYLAGPYKGAPLSLAVVVPAVAGPFDLGTVVVRNALYVDPTTTQVHAVSDPFPHILQGIPLDIRSVDLRLDRPQFTKNPTNCSPFAISGSAAALTGASAPLSSRFQASDCAALGFKPSLKLSLKGQTKRTGNPVVRAVLTTQPGQANIAATTVVLPKSEFIDNAHINNPCTRVQFNASACPPSSILGTARAYSPLLAAPLEGPVYFRSNGGERELPDLVADLNGQIHVTLVGFIDSVGKKGTETSRVRTRFLGVPDAPVSRFELSLYGGKRGLIENSENICQFRRKAQVTMVGQNGRLSEGEQKLVTSCGRKSRGGGKAHGKKHG